ncbi:6511_t:CDS:10 [Scutellospora calospora]|uniref:6511_t:CDS:1 n=1 Tax=Scutellospora calospora TaxID=85575 RepID=A0ACA9KD18_9GLOM|nr:6511_t:CDS:10 [Scutellospora calospora]
MDLDYKSGYREYTYYKYLLSSNNKNDTTLLELNILPKFIKYLISMNSEKIFRKDLISKILIAYIDALSLIPECMPFLQSFVLASSSNANKCSWHIVYSHTQFIDYRELKGFTKKVIELVEELYSKFIDVGLLKSHFNLRLLGSAKENRVKRLAILSKPVEEKFKHIDDNDALVKGANLNTLYMTLNMKKTNSTDLFEKIGILYLSIITKNNTSQITKALALIRKSINVKEIEDALDAFPDFLNEEPSTTLIYSTVDTGKTKTLRKICNESEAKFKELEKFNFKAEQYQNIVADLKTYDGVHARESFNAMHDLLNVATHIKQCQDNFANIDTTWSALDCIIYTSTVEAGISFEISGYFDAVIGITNIATSVHIETFAQMLFRICDYLLCIVLLHHSKKFDIFKELCQELIQAELLALSLIASTEVTLELILVEDTEKVNRKETSHTIKNIEEKIKGADAESIANASNITFDEAEILKQNPICSFTNNIALQLGFSSINDTKILSEDALLLFGFKSQAKETPDLKATESTYWIYHVSDNRARLITQEELIDIKSNTPNYHLITPILLLYKLESINKTQKLFDSIPITTNIAISKSSNEVCKESSCNNIVEKSVTNLL